MELTKYSGAATTRDLNKNLSRGAIKSMFKLDWLLNDHRELTVNSLPRPLIAAALLLTLLRGADLMVTFSQHSRKGVDHNIQASTPSSNIRWQALPAVVVPTPSQTGKAVVVAPKPAEPDLSHESEVYLNGLTTEAAKENKYVLFEFAANWSDPCRQMEVQALSNPTVVDLLSQKFVPVRVRNLERETGTNSRVVTELAKKYRVFAYPTLVVVDKNGKLVTSLIGNCSALTTNRFLSRALAMAERNEKAKSK